MTTHRPLAILALALVVQPFALRAIGMTESLGTEIALFALVGLGFNLLLGYTGLLSFGHGLFFGFAAYAAALSQLHWFHDSLIWPVLFAVAATALLGLVVGFLALRRRGVYFSLLTLAFTARQVSPGKVKNAVVPSHVGTSGAASVVFIDPSAKSIYANMRKDGLIN